MPWPALLQCGSRSVSPVSDASAPPHRIPQRPVTSAVAPSPPTRRLPCSCMARSPAAAAAALALRFLAQQRRHALGAAPRLPGLFAPPPHYTRAAAITNKHPPAAAMHQERQGILRVQSAQQTASAAARAPAAVRQRRLPRRGGAGSRRCVWHCTYDRWVALRRRKGASSCSVYRQTGLR